MRGDGWGLSYSYMINGRAGEDHFYTQFFPNGFIRNLNSLKEETNVSGWQLCSTQLQKALFHGQAKIWLANGRIFQGDFQCGKMKEGRLSELQTYSTYTIY
jgi:hypothetical protein